MPGNYFYDVIVPQARQALEDAVGIRVTGIQPYVGQVPTNPPFSPTPGPMASQLHGFGVNAQMGPVQANAQFSPNMGFQGANVGTNLPVAGGNLGVMAEMGPRMGLQRLSGGYQRGDVNVGASYQPGRGFGVQAGFQRGPLGLRGGYEPGRGINLGFDVRQRFNEGGLATSTRLEPEARQRDIEFIDTRNQRMREVVEKAPLKRGGLAVVKGRKHG